MKERPILFSGPMIRALLANEKSQTRRVVKPQPQHVWGFGVGRSDPDHFTAHVRYPGGSPPDPWVRCPYGKPGDHLWCRETWAKGMVFAGDVQEYLYRATHTRAAPSSWRPSIFMPRAACRITLEITGVRVERVQSISDDDVIAEGAFDPRWTRVDNNVQKHYASLWDSINGKTYPWTSNPFVWAVSFRRVQP